MTMKEKLELMKEIERRNQERIAAYQQAEKPKKKGDAA